MFQDLTKASYLPFRMRMHIILSLLVISIYGCQDDPVIGSIPVPGTPHQTNPYDWSLQYTEVFVDLKDVFFVDQSAGWVVGDNNTILSTTMSGNTWPQAPINDFPGNFRSVHMISENKGWITGDMNGNTEDGSIYPYEFSPDIDEGPAGIPGINGGIGLNEIFIISNTNITSIYGTTLISFIKRFFVRRMLMKLILLSYFYPVAWRCNTLDNSSMKLSKRVANRSISVA